MLLIRIISISISEIFKKNHIFIYEMSLKILKLILFWYLHEFHTNHVAKIWIQNKFYHFKNVPLFFWQFWTFDSSEKNQLISTQKQTLHYNTTYRRGNKFTHRSKLVFSCTTTLIVRIMGGVRAGSCACASKIGSFCYALRSMCANFLQKILSDTSSGIS